MEKDLRRLLDELSAALKRTREGHGDQAELDRLRKAVEDRLEADDTSEEDRGHLLDALRLAEARFELEHPTLAEAIRDAIYALSSAGI